MNFKITTLNFQVDCNEQFIPEFPTLHFGTIPKDGPAVFDSTGYYLANDIEEVDYRSFQRVNMRYIQGLIDNTGLDSKLLFFRNKDAHLLMNQELMFLFLMFANPSLTAYFNSFLGELFGNGISFSDSFIYSLASERIPSNALSQIINSRNNAKKA